MRAARWLRDAEDALLSLRPSWLVGARGGAGRSPYYQYARVATQLGVGLVAGAAEAAGGARTLQWQALVALALLGHLALAAYTACRAPCADRLEGALGSAELLLSAAALLMR